MEELNVQFDESFKRLHKLCMAVEVDVDCSNQCTAEEEIIISDYRDQLEYYAID